MLLAAAEILILFRFLNLCYNSLEHLEHHN
jgi:hypothetical protein